MAELQSSDGRTEVEGKEGQDAPNYAEQSGAPGLHVESEVEVSGVDNEHHPTMMQKLKERITDAENHMKGKESSVKEDPHPELSYITAGSEEEREGSGGDLYEGKQHGGEPVAALGRDDIPAENTRDVSSLLKDDNLQKAKTSEPEVHEHPHVRTTVSVEGADEPTTMEKIKGKFFEVENQMKGKRTPETEDPHPELAYVMPTPQEHTLAKDNLAGQVDEVENREETINPAAVPLEADKGVQPVVAPEVQNADKGVGSNELGTGYEEGSEGSIGHVPNYSKLAELEASEQIAEKQEVDTTSKDADVSPDAKAPGTGEQVEEAQAVTEDTQEKDHQATSGEEKQKKPGFLSRLAKKLSGGKKHDS